MDKAINAVVGVVGAAVSYFYGGWSTLLDALLWFVIIDYVSGVIASGKEGLLSSRVGLFGIAKKVFIFVMVAVAHKIDLMLGDAHFFRDSTIFFYLSNELLSILENGGRMGLPIPEPITRAVQALRDRQGGVSR